MRLHAYLAQALPPRPVKAGPVVAQLPKISLGEDVEALGDVKGLTEVVNRLEEKGDERAADVKKALDDWGKVDVVDASFKGTSNISFPSHCCFAHVARSY
jgi:translocation protein SEC63